MLNSILEYHLSIGQAAEIMGVSERHTKRLLAAYRKDGTAALVHGNRGWQLLLKWWAPVIFGGNGHDNGWRTGVLLDCGHETTRP